MTELILNAVNSLKYSNEDSIAEIFKLTRIGQYAFWNISRGCSPPYVEALGAVNALKEIEAKERTGSSQDKFSNIKTETLKVFNEIQPFLDSLNSEPSINLMMHGKGGVNQWDKISFALLMVEQNNYDWFKDRESHLPSQPHDRLSSYYVIYTDSGMINIKFTDESLPKHIMDEALAAFKIAGEQKPQ
ncbi:MAG: hypothetical protein NTW29_22715 [Bacteroidetes bacterium]|nr:hypothetical protein [Bacteroidota bacterium]